MLRTAELGILFKPPQNVIDDNKDLPVVNSYMGLRKIVGEQLEIG
jgi:hypothetical protein